MAGNVENFATKEFQARLLRAFRTYALEDMRAKLRSDAELEIRAELLTEE
jgi:hypothetical protein